MAAYKKKIISFLVVVVLGSGALVVPVFAETALRGTPPCGNPKQGSAQSTTAGPAAENSKFKAGSLFANDPNLLVKPADGRGSQELFFKMMLAVTLVIVLGAAAIYISKKFLPRITNLPGKKVRIIETLHLGPRKMVHVLKIGNQRLLIGSTNETITKLADVTDAFSETEAGCEGSRRRFENRDVFNSETDLSTTETDNN